MKILFFAQKVRKTRSSNELRVFRFLKVNDIYSY